MTRVAVTRPARLLPAAEEYLRSKGLEAVPVPMIEMVPRNDGGVESFIDRLRAGRVDAVILTSQNGVGFLLDRGGKDLIGMLCNAEVFAIGPKTKKALEQNGIMAKGMPSTFSSECLASEFSFPGKRVEVLRSDHGSPALIKGLKEGGAMVTETILYDIVPLAGGEQESFIREALSGSIDAFTFTSAMTAKSLLLMAESMGALEELKREINSKKVAAIGHPTAEFLKNNGIRVDVVPERFTFEEMIDALARVL